MKCDYCGSENAVISVYEYTAKGKKEKHLCLDCAIDKGLSLSPDDLENLTHNFIEQLVNFVPLLKKGKKRQSQAVCSECRTSVKTILKTKKAGCPECYYNFPGLMDRIVFRKNNSLNYKGYLPEKIQLIVDNKNKILKLKRELKILINNENFTRASEVRDEINELRKMNKLYKEEI